MWHECSCTTRELPSDFRHPDHNKRAVVLEPVKDQPLRVGATRPSLTASVRAGSTRLWVGAKKRLARSNKETLREEKWIGPFGHPLDKNLPIQGLRTPATTTLPRTPTAGVGKAPMDEIARGGRRRCGERYEGLMLAPTLMSTNGTTRAAVDGTFNRVMPWSSWNRRRRTQPERAGTDLE
jgi:hypothetical protein